MLANIPRQRVRASSASGERDLLATRDTSDGCAIRGSDADWKTMKKVFETSVGTVEVRIDHDSRTIGVYRFDDQHRATAAAIETWDDVELVDVFSRQIGVPLQEAYRIADAVRDELSARSLSERLNDPITEHERVSMRARLEKAGILLRFVAVVLDAVIVLFPLSIVIGLMNGGGYVERGDGYANAGVDVTGMAAWLLLMVGLAYYILGEALTGATLGKRMVRIRVVDEHGEHPRLRAAVVRNILRPVDAFCFYLVGAVFALTSPLGQRLGDRAAHTVVVRR
jgi:uncharacterized RDD family membrane protein YckC